MWIDRDFELILRRIGPKNSLPVKVLKGPRQVGKTTLLERLTKHKLVFFDDLVIRTLARENPALFFQQFPGPLI
jgi:predicted AAA+ superfamily ATPase